MLLLLLIIIIIIIKTENSLCARHHSRLFTCVSSFHPHNTPVRYTQILAPFDGQGNWQIIERLNKLSVITL